jgi:hypothetical protein
MSTSKDGDKPHSEFCGFKQSLLEKLRRSSSIQSRLLFTNYFQLVSQHFPLQLTFDFEMLVATSRKP